MSLAPLPAERLFRPCDPACFPFETTEEVPDLDQFIGQDRAEAAIRFAAGMRHDGYNLYALGPAGTGKRSLVEQLLRKRAAQEPVPDDWCYVHNFAAPHRPRALRLPAGRGARLRGDMVRLVEELRVAIPGAFEADQYRTRVEAIHAEYGERQEKALRELGDEAAAHGIALLRMPDGFVFAPIREGKVLSPEEYEKLPDDEKRHIDAQVAGYQARLEEILRAIPKWRREMREALRRLNEQTAMLAVGQIMDELFDAYQDLPDVLAYLQAVRDDVLQNTDLFLKAGEAAPGGEGGIGPFNRYQVNLLVDHGDASGAPIVTEDHPTYNNLIGRVEHLAQMGALITDFTLIKPGALHRANGGYLLLEAHRLLAQPFAWEALKRALYAKSLRIESVGQILSLVPTVSLEPEAIPLEVKVVLLGDRFLYYLLQELDPEFAELFKVAADFEDTLPRDDRQSALYARLIATLVRREGLLPFHREAVARVVEHASRLAEDAEKLTAHMRSVADLLRQADYAARAVQAERVEAVHVEEAIAAMEARSDRLKRRLQEEILRGTLLIDTEGATVGSINGLSVVELGEARFAHPTRITATTRIGDGDVINIEREVELSGAIHSKGVMILASFLAARYARNRPLSLTASLAFEQSYGFVEGDSASLAELCALLSDLAQVPIRQGLAVTGSVNQFGQVQAIGAVNEKIEGFFDICAARGLTGEQGVLIPAANVKHLMLARRVREACAAGRFHIYAVETVDEAMEILTGVPAGLPDEEGNLPEGSINWRVAAQLYELSLIRQEFAGAGRKRGRKSGSRDQ
ncbi:MAG: AAA family ATPase [Burkholderiales bacterium]|nr:AAA family ATPase [Burkholderiales bacterium]